MAPEECPLEGPASPSLCPDIGGPILPGVAGVGSGCMDVIVGSRVGECRCRRRGR